MENNPTGPNNPDTRLHVRRAGTDEKKESPRTPSKAICSEPVPQELLLTDMKFMMLEANHRCTNCERIQNRAIQTVKLKRGEGPVKPKDLQDIYADEPVNESVNEPAHEPAS